MTGVCDLVASIGITYVRVLESDKIGYTSNTNEIIGYLAVVIRVNDYRKRQEHVQNNSWDQSSLYNPVIFNN